MQSFARLHNCDYYLIDYFSQKLHFSSPTSLMLCGYPIDEAEEQGISFYNTIIQKSEWRWLFTMNEKAYDILYGHEISKRKDLVIYYDMELLNKSGNVLSVNHTLTPLELDARGNMWFALCRVILSPSSCSSNARILNKKTGERWNFNENEFRKSISDGITDEDIAILRHLATDSSVQDIIKQLNTTERTYYRRLKALQKKLGANSTTALIYKTQHLLGVI